MSKRVLYGAAMLIISSKLYSGSQRFSSVGEELRSAKREAVKREIEKRWENLWFPAAVDWSYRANRFELRSRTDPVSWLVEPYRCVVIGCFLIDLVMLIDSYRSMIVRSASPATRGFLSPLLWWKKTSGTRVPKLTGKPKIGNLTNTTGLYSFLESKKWCLLFRGFCGDVTSHENQE